MEESLGHRRFERRHSSRLSDTRNRYRTSRRISRMSVDTTDTSPPPYDYLEWILLCSPHISPRFIGLLSIDDIVSLSQVCRSWRHLLVPAFRNQFSSVINLEYEWHPLVTSLVARVLPTTQPDESELSEMIPYTRYPIDQGSEESRRGFSIFKLIKVFRNEYFSALTTVDLDGTRLNAYTSNLKWVNCCTNLEKLSIRRCAGVRLEDLANVLLLQDNFERGYTTNKFDYRRLRSKRNPNVSKQLSKVYFWGIEGTQRMAWSHFDNEDDSNRRELEVLCRKMIKVYNTDVRFCTGFENQEREQRPFERGYSRPGPQYRVLFSAIETCGICHKTRQRQCRTCKPKVTTCERCLGFVCSDCLVVKPIPDVRHLSNPAPNMLSVRCDHEYSCVTDNYPHYIHPGCIPKEMWIWGQGNLLATSIFELYAREFYMRAESKSRGSYQSHGFGTTWLRSNLPWLF
ncbi:hypothetical protein TWF694_011392 [Orbilia ellipsospora]|uniref:F-box domain-containing protein n=1 Tax=Orbilia ellipsospora TaxID=2528407 RepID=A0AAV9X6C7_9PEZI